MSKINNDLRKFYRTHKAKCSFSVSDSIEEALSIFFSSLKNHDIQVDFEYRGLEMGYGIPTEYSQIVLHILTNIRETFDTNCIKTRNLKIQISSTEGFIVVEFTDNAGGIEPIQISKVLDPNFSSEDHKTGMGLYITKMIIENMDGHIQVENTSEGSCYVLSVPKVSSKNKTTIVSD
jgi:signal transduction histidine kinase